MALVKIYAIHIRERRVLRSIPMTGRVVEDAVRDRPAGQFVKPACEIRSVSHSLRSVFRDSLHIFDIKVLFGQLINGRDTIGAFPFRHGFFEVLQVAQMTFSLRWKESKSHWDCHPFIKR